MLKPAGSVCIFLLSGAIGVRAQVASVPLSIPATLSAINAPTPLSERVVHYDIEARYDAERHTLDASETLTYHNLTGQALDTFPFHLYLNGFQPTSTWVGEGKREGTRGQRFDRWDPKSYGRDEIEKFEVVDQGDLTSQLQFIHPDDDNQQDKTVVEVRLPKPVPPEGYVEFKIKFHDQFPETLERTGWNRDFLLAGQWFPKVGVWWQGAWNCHQFHAYTEFFADFGVYDVKLTVPQNEVVGASGVELGTVNNRDGTKTVTYHGDDIHDFAWTVSPHYKDYYDIFQGSMGPVKIRIMMQPSHWSQAERHDRIVKETMDRFERWYGPYPYKTLTVVDPEPGSAAYGMEYPTFITGGTSWFVPRGLLLPEVVLVHEFGHQYWYGMVATNEFEDAWMDEGINSYSEVKVLDSVFGPATSVINLAGVTLGDREALRLEYLEAADLDPMARNGWQYADSTSYGGISYGKTACVLLTLEGILGEDNLRQAMHTYFLRYRFTHPTKEDFLKTIEEVSGKDLRWYFNQAVYGTEVLDYEVLKVSSYPLDWYREQAHEKPGQTEYVSNLWIHRRNDFVFPVEFEVKFENGERIREHWDGRDRWVKYAYLKRARIQSVAIDPEHRIELDRNNFNNSYVVKAVTAPARKLVNDWTFCSQLFAQFLAWWLV
ncbi:MAG TPA: M1 family metallopeptidase [Terriglobales bacterium]|nr:M1 family metallopeptidase [Terriglobales bacterium]